ncbi:hypothetical protein [Hippea maritima]|uniref:Uncharacterized protein n=1 Tax=Hippea maritima (strain ATCC 700847 / DSM 10411 / MH2) TaxID=760142 RepID=F2LUL8_HIPMA|nr:hypothetical protein [Hippea maritima]AEA34608.1 hypothetical protein Hipma_1662 [Hippea maritima DSM 10411]
MIKLKIGIFEAFTLRAILVLIFVSHGFFGHCYSMDTVNTPENKNSSKIVILSGKIVGLVEVSKNDVYITTNYTSRSRVSYKASGNLKDELKKLKGKVVEVKGIRKRIGWSGEIEVEKIIKIVK